MALQHPQFDLLANLDGGSDSFDSDLGGVLLTDDYFGPIIEVGNPSKYRDAGAFTDIFDVWVKDSTFKKATFTKIKTGGVFVQVS